MDIDPNRISIHHGWFDRRPYVLAFNDYVKRFDKRVYCSFDYDDGFYKVYKALPFKLWGALGDFDGKGFLLFTIKTRDGKPRPPHKNDVLQLKSMEMKKASYQVKKQSSWWKKYEL